MWVMLLANLALWVSYTSRNLKFVFVNRCFPGLTRALAAEVGKSKVRVNVIIPGYIETEMTAGILLIHQLTS